VNTDSPFPVGTSAEIDLPSLKERLWQKMRDDLKDYIPDISGTNLAMCPTCCRFLPIENFNIEHVIPQQSLADDPPEVRDAIPKNERGVTILLCNKRLQIREKTVYWSGCNSWKGRFYDKYLRETFNARVTKNNSHTSRHQTALFNACYLGLFAKYGYQITLAPSGLIMRRQFFSPNRFNKDVPLSCQIILMGDAESQYDELTDKYWRPPFKFTFEPNLCYVGVRNTSMTLPMSRNPETPIVHKLPFAPPKYALRPDFQTIFH